MGGSGFQSRPFYLSKGRLGALNLELHHTSTGPLGTGTLCRCAEAGSCMKLATIGASA